MSLYINSIVGSYVVLPEEIEDAYELSEELEVFCKKSGYSISHHEEDLFTKTQNILTFGKKGSFNVQGMYGGWFMSLTDFVKPQDYSNEKEKNEVKKELDKFLAALPEEYQFVKQLEWSEVDVYINTFT